MVRPAHLDLSIRYPQVRVDARESWADLGRKWPPRFAADLAARARATAEVATQRLAREGDALAAVERGATVATVVRARAAESGAHDVTVSALPAHRPRVQLDPGSVHVRLNPADVRGFEVFA